MTETLSSIWQWIVAHYQWLISGLILPLIAIWLSQRGKKVAIQEQIARIETKEQAGKAEKKPHVKVDTRPALSWSQMRAIENRRVADNIAHRSFVQNVIKGIGTIAVLSWLFSDADEEYDDE